MIGIEEIKVQTTGINQHIKTIIARVYIKGKIVQELSILSLKISQIIINQSVVKIVLTRAIIVCALKTFQKLLTTVVITKLYSSWKKAKLVVFIELKYFFNFSKSIIKAKLNINAIKIFKTIPETVFICSKIFFKISKFFSVKSSLLFSISFK